MSKELIDDILDRIAESEQEEFPEIVEDILSYGFIEDVVLGELFDMELDDLDSLLRDAEFLTHKQWKSYCSKLKSYLNKEKKKYTRLYYREPAQKGR